MSFYKKIIINTDSDTIKKGHKEISKNIIIFNRPNEFSGNDITMNKIIEHDINKADSEFYIQTHTTNPLHNTIFSEKST